MEQMIFKHQFNYLLLYCITKILIFFKSTLELKINKIKKNCT